VIAYVTSTQLSLLACFFFKLVRWDFGYCGHYWPIIPALDDSWWWLWRNWWNEDWQGKPQYSEKTCPSSTLSTTNPTWLDPGLNPGRFGGKPATNRFSYGAAFLVCYLHKYIGHTRNFCIITWYSENRKEDSASPMELARPKIMCILKRGTPWSMFHWVLLCKNAVW
jgi:hypothetical protein